MASLQNGELPNPKGVLCQVNQSTKAVLNLLGVFTVSSFHAFICARRSGFLMIFELICDWYSASFENSIFIFNIFSFCSPSLLSNLLAGRGASRKRSLPNNQSLEQNERQGSLGSTPKSFDDDEDDFNESSLIHAKIPGKKVLKYAENYQIYLDSRKCKQVQTE